MEKKRTFIGWLKYLKRKNAKGKNFVKPDVSGNEANQLTNKKDGEVAALLNTGCTALYLYCLSVKFFDLLSQNS